MSPATRKHTAIAVITLLGLVACGADEPAAGTSTAPSEAASGPSEAVAAPSQAPPAESEPASEPGAETAEVRIASSVYQPSELTVSVGTEVVFVNEDSFAHTVTEGTDGDAVDDPIVDEDVAGGEEVRVTFDEPGTFDITCRFHPSMQMTVVVEG